MVKLSDAATLIQEFEGSGFGKQISLIETRLKGVDKSGCIEICTSAKITPLLFDSASLLKQLAGQINVMIHALGILLSLPHILYDGEVIEALSLGAGNTGKAFDLETDRRVAEFKFNHWRGSPESIRQNQLFKDFFLLAEYTTLKEKFLYVVDDTHPVRFLNGSRALSSILSRNNKLWQEFTSKYEDFKIVNEYYNYRKTAVNLVDLRKCVPEFANGFDSVFEENDQEEL